VDSAYLQVAPLSELFAAVIELAAEWLDLLVNDLVCLNVATMCKCLSANVTTVWSLPSVSPLMYLPGLVLVSNTRRSMTDGEVALLRESLSTT
jgi:hypothetical protein